tara:strand:- start:445 stop:549 length:105 start_codon:yes stop_codon:yes gene_type:complete
MNQKSRWQLLGNLEVMGDKLGAVFFQLPPNEHAV